MSRPSSAASLHPRQSLWPGGQPVPRPEREECSPHLLACVEAVNTASQHIHHAHSSLREGVSDLPRMASVLENERLFVVVNSSLVHRYKSQLADEIEPHVHSLTSRANKALKELEREASSMQAKVSAAESSTGSKIPSTSAVAKMETRRLAALTKQRERLEKELSALQEEIDDLESELPDD
ncbi:hypothetical protein SISSUDRAFT_1058072 [Sistotremastrum suecicum HHB10207 ss-3]|uniref:DASH complex subunit SPC19 n=1 Tax=Sistotremastrum suecicum HHB10207 ss-3 TaxID=1314776 RepID=A0A166HPH9_9AGAM|nr:hypothetical protein SISSUDRAFT_1058072 [Sistotremastrum suecicum HHB10207 ss-3]